MQNTVSQANQFQEGNPLFPGVFTIHAGKAHREGDILQTGHHADEVIALEDITDLAATQPGQFDMIELGHIHLVDINLAASGLAQAANHVEKSGFSRTAGTHDGKIFPAINIYRGAAQRMRLLVTPAIDFFDIHSPDDAGPLMLRRGSEQGRDLGFI